MNTNNLHPDNFEYNIDIQPKQKVVQHSKLYKNFIDKNVSKDIPLFSNSQTSNYARSVLHGIQEVSPFSNLFFSAQNIAEIQRLIRYNVYIHTEKEHIIDNQDETKLVIVMRGVYLQYYRQSQMDPQTFKNEIEKLNSLVVTQVLPDLLSNLEQYMNYIKDISQNYTPLSIPKNTSVIGERTARTWTDIMVGEDKFFN
jgi:ferric iron reductase protein FhuF